jgi:hypothetical protein
VAHWIGAGVEELAGDLEAALAERDAEIALLLEVGNPRNLAGAHVHRAKMLAQLDRPDESDTAAAMAREVADVSGQEDLARQVEATLADLGR